MARQRKKPNYSKQIKVLWSLFVFALLGIALLFIATYFGFLGDLPSISEIERTESEIVSEVYSSDNVLLGKFYKQNRSLVKYKDLSPHLVNALIATEDERFRTHAGIDYKGTARAIYYRGRRGGASTITQQLAKNLYTGPRSINVFSRIKQKLTEWVTAIRLERLYAKNEIITLYFNTFDFIYQAVGIRSASRIYFNKEPKDLKIEEAAVLVGMAKNPSLYNPKKFPENSKARRNIVFKQMNRNGFLTKREMDSLKALPLVIKFTKISDNSQGIAKYFLEHIRQELDDWFEKNPKPNGDKYNLYTDGLKIYTTLNYKMQKHAEEAVKKHLSSLQKVFDREHKNRINAPFYHISKKEINKIMQAAMKRSDRYKRLKALEISDDSIQKIFNTPVKMKVFSWNGDSSVLMSPMDSIRYYKSFLQTGVLSIEPQTGFIRAWVGGNDYEYFKYDHVEKGKRQVGSTFKPLVYATAIDQIRYSPCHMMPNTRIQIGSWSPKNVGGKYGGYLTLKKALANSVNVITARLIYQTGIQPVIKLARNLGITSDIPKNATIALGTPDISVFEMVGAFSAFANKGIYNKPISILRIENKEGNLIYEAMPKSREVISEETAYIMIELLKGVSRDGTGKRLHTKYNMFNEIAGKTGTTQNNSDGWFIGSVPNLVTGIWVGCEDRAAHFYGTGRGQGAVVALPIWVYYMKSLYSDKGLSYYPKEKFEKPELDLSIELNCDDYIQNGDDGIGKINYEEF